MERKTLIRKSIGEDSNISVCFNWAPPSLALATQEFLVLDTIFRSAAAAAAVHLDPGDNAHPGTH